MTKIIAAGLAAAIPAGCERGVTSRADQQPAVLAHRALLVWTDPQTGCDYIAPSGSTSTGVMPRVAADGFHAYCRSQKAERLSAPSVAP